MTVTAPATVTVTPPKTVTVSPPQPTVVVPDDPQTKVATPDLTMPTSVRTYANQFVRAWGLGDTVKMSRYATGSAIADLQGLGYVGGPHWNNGGVVYQDGRAYVTFDNTDTGQSFLVYLDPSLVSQGSQQAIDSILVGGSGGE